MLFLSQVLYREFPPPSWRLGRPQASPPDRVGWGGARQSALLPHLLQHDPPAGRRVLPRPGESPPPRCQGGQRGFHDDLTTTC